MRSGRRTRMRWLPTTVRAQPCGCSDHSAPMDGLRSCAGKAFLAAVEQARWSSKGVREEGEEGERFETAFTSPNGRRRRFPFLSSQVLLCGMQRVTFSALCERHGLSRLRTMLAIDERMVEAIRCLQLVGIVD
ncbi:unnamed protein product [Prorocentrum cordatum]|uniref:Uncharacterized protein n=1 Tax=Prorocentrum cordatum TaxID=2364126 RepID=A0ABN9YF30_9DINO|nr:unnamed protein product [Polarella glacialis]